MDMSTHTRQPQHTSFLCTSCREELNLINTFQGDTNTHTGPTALLFVSAPFDDSVPTSSESDSSVLTQPTDRPTATIIAPASVVLSPEWPWDSCRVLQHAYEFSDISVVLDSSICKLSSYETGDDSTTMQHHAVSM